MAFAGVSFVGDGRWSTATRSASATSATVTDSGYHLIVVHRYSRTKQDYPNGECFKSRPFRVAGYRWVVQYYPNGRIGHDADYVSLFLCMDDDVSVTDTVNVQFGFTFVDKVYKQQQSEIRARKVHGFNNQTHCRGYYRFMKREDLEKSAHLKDDCLTIKCDIIVTKDVSTGATTAAPFVAVPESDMHQHFTSLLQSGEGADVTFQVGGEIFAAHWCILASRSTVLKAQLLGSTDEGSTARVIRMDNMELAAISPVLRAKLFGPKEGTTTGVIRIADMEAKVFKLLLNFIYSDLMPDIEAGNDSEEDSNVDEAEVMLQHLLVAADRYDIQRLKLMCEEKLCGCISTTTVATILELAEQHHCGGLKEACLDFLNLPANLQEVMAAGGLNHLRSICPSVLIDLIAKLASLKLDNCWLLIVFK